MRTVTRESVQGPDGRVVPRAARQRTRPGLKEVAKRAGVGVSSVSRVLTGHPEVSEVMRNRVMDAVAAIRYEPDLLAQSMRTGATMTIGFVVSDISNPLISEIALGAELRLREAGYSMMVTNSLNKPEVEADYIALLTRRRVDGLMLSITDETSEMMDAAVRRFDSAVVLVDRHVAGADYAAVNCDHAHGITEAFDHLVSLGHTRIGMVNGSPNVRPSRERAAALRRATRGSGTLSTVIRSAGFTPAHGYDATMKMMAGKDAPTAIIAGSNQILIGVLRALRGLGLSIPGDVSLVTCDAVPLADFLDPPLSTIARVPREMGRMAAELLLEQLAGEEPRTVMLPTQFVATLSCGPAADTHER